MNVVLPSRLLASLLIEFGSQHAISRFLLLLVPLDLLLDALILLLDRLVLVLIVADLATKQLFILFLTNVFNPQPFLLRLEFSMLLIEPLGQLSHYLKLLIERLLFLLRVLVILLLFHVVVLQFLPICCEVQV